MQFFANYFSLITALVLCLLSSIAVGVNYFFFQYPANNYFPPGMTLIALILFLTLLGTYFLFERHSPFFKIARELCYLFLVITVIAYTTYAAQLTPFPTIDSQLIKIDSILNINLERTIAWVANRPRLREMLALSYDSLPYQMCYLPLALIIARKIASLREYYALLLFTGLLGFTIYYFLPTMGPASWIKSPYFIQEQYATGIKYSELHHHIIPSTVDGGLVAMPSFHVIWAWLCLNMLRCWTVAFIMLLPINILLVAACVLLGWHYFIDLIGSLIVLLISHGVYSCAMKCKNNK